MAFPPIVVAHLGAVFPVGVVRWKQFGSHRLSVFAKLTFAGDGSPDGEPEPLLGSVAAERVDPGDHVPRKAGVDVVLVGSARGPSGAERFAGSVSIPSARRLGTDEGPWRRDLVFVASPTSPLVALANGHVLELDGVTRAGSLGRSGEPLASPWREGALEQSFDFERCHAAAPAQRIDAIAPGAAIELRGALDFTGRGALRVPAAPWLFVDRGFGDGQTLALRCDTITLDFDTGRSTFVWRVDFDVDDPVLADVDRIVAQWVPEPTEVDVDELRSGVPRAHFVLAEELGREPLPSDADVLHVAKFEALEIAAPPDLDIRTYARISAELAEGRPPREQVLAKHGLTEEAWTLEERAHGQLLADRANHGDVEGAVVFGEAFVAAQDSLADPREADWTVEQHGLLAAQLETTRDVPAALAEHALTLGAYLRIDRRIAKLLEADVDARQRFDKALEDGRLAYPEPDDEDLQDDDEEAEEAG